MRCFVEGQITHSSTASSRVCSCGLVSKLRNRAEVLSTKAELGCTSMKRNAKRLKFGKLNRSVSSPSLHEVNVLTDVICFTNKLFLL